jgi:hypothetical protein
MKVTVIVSSVFILIGAGMFLGAIYLYQDSRSFLAQAIRTDGVVVDLEKNDKSKVYNPVVTFIDQEGAAVSFTSSIGSNPPSYAKGEKVDVLYLAASPQKARIDGFMSIWGGAVIFGGLGSTFFLIGVLIILVIMVKGRRDQYLQKKGLPIETEFQGVELNKAVSVNGRNPFRITTQWLNPETSEIHVFKSNDLWFDPTDHIKNKKIRVFVEKDNPRKYYVDISFLPKLAK